jgi:hypothetical protein
MQYFERDRPVVPEVSHKVHRCHAPSAQLSLDLIAGAVGSRRGCAHGALGCGGSPRPDSRASAAVASSTKCRCAGIGMS